LRRFTLIKELRANINSQVIEQLHSSTKYSVHSLNNMKPVNHIFLMRSMLDYRNVRKKRSLTTKLQTVSSRQSSFISLDRFGGHIICKVKKEEGSTTTPSSSVVNDKAANQNALPSTAHDSWVSDLLLKIQDKHIIESGLWLNDRIINAAVTLIKQSMDYNINGFEDVITGKNCGYTHNENLSEFIQIIHLPQHWVCVSNIMRRAADAAIVYDSSHDLNMKKTGKIRYDCSIEEAVCELISPSQAAS